MPARTHAPHSPGAQPVPRPEDVLDSLADGVITVDRGGRILWANAKAKSMLGLDVFPADAILADVLPDALPWLAGCLNGESPGRPFRADVRGRPCACAIRPVRRKG